MWMKSEKKNNLVLSAVKTGCVDSSQGVQNHKINNCVTFLKSTKNLQRIIKCIRAHKVYHYFLTSIYPTFCSSSERCLRPVLTHSFQKHKLLDILTHRAGKTLVFIFQQAFDICTKTMDTLNFWANEKCIHCLNTYNTVNHLKLSQFCMI